MDEIPTIPAMTSEAERRCYYELAKEQNRHGYVVELGAWLGAATAWMAAGVRDSGIARQMHTYDRFQWNPSQHNRKAGGPLSRDLLAQFKFNLGPLMRYVVPHKGEIADLVWDEGNVALIVFDAPKRVKAISPALTAFAEYVYCGSVIAWQDFTYSASYDIPATMYRLRHKLEFLEAVPGSTAVFRVREAWKAKEVTPEALSTDNWTGAEIEKAWAYWLPCLPDDMAAHFRAGEAMFLCDRGLPDRARAIMREVLHNSGDTIIGTWRDMKQHRPVFLKRFAPLFGELRGLL